MVIVDSSVWIDTLTGRLNPQSIWLNQAFGKEEIGLTSLILCEVLQGVRSETQFQGFLHDLLEFPVLEAASPQLAIAAARNYLRLRTQGITVRKTIDCLIATFCIEEGYQLLHNDHDFNAFEEHLKLNVFHAPAIH